MSSTLHRLAYREHCWLFAQNRKCAQDTSAHGSALESHILVHLLSCRLHGKIIGSENMLMPKCALQGSELLYTPWL